MLEFFPFSGLIILVYYNFMFSLKLPYLFILSSFWKIFLKYFTYFPVLVHVTTSLKILYYIGFDLYYIIV